LSPDEISGIDARLFKPNLALQDLKELFRENIKTVIIELSDYCNRKCSYCPVSLVHRDKALNRMSQAHFEKIIDDLRAIEFDRNICLNLFNEPLGDPSIYGSVARLVEALPNSNVWFNSNGDYVSRRTLDRLADVGLKRLVVTLHIPKTGHYDDLQQLSRYSQFSARTRVPLRFEKYKPGKSITAAGRYRGIALRVKSSNFDTTGYDRAGSMEHLSILEPRQAPCDRPFQDFTIAWTGDVYPCCHFMAGLDTHEDYVCGNVGTAESLYQIYGTQLLAGFRTDLFGYGPKTSPCDTCAEYDDRRCEKDRLAREAKMLDLQRLDPDVEFANLPDGLALSGDGTGGQ